MPKLSLTRDQIDATLTGIYDIFEFLDSGSKIYEGLLTIDSGNSKVGVGEANPQKKLDIGGSLRIQGIISQIEEEARQPDITDFPNNNEWGVFRNTATSELSLAINDSGTIRRISLTNTGGGGGGSGVTSVAGETGVVTASELLTAISVESGADVTDETNVTDALDGATLLDVGTPAANDKIFVQDSSDGDTLKTAAFSTFGGGGGGVTTAIEIKDYFLGGRVWDIGGSFGVIGDNNWYYNETGNAEVSKAVGGGIGVVRLSSGTGDCYISTQENNGEGSMEISEITGLSSMFVEWDFKMPNSVDTGAYYIGLCSTGLDPANGFVGLRNTGGSDFNFVSISGSGTEDASASTIAVDSAKHAVKITSVSGDWGLSIDGETVITLTNYFGSSDKVGFLAKSEYNAGNTGVLDIDTFHFYGEE